MQGGRYTEKLKGRRKRKINAGVTGDLATATPKKEVCATNASPKPGGMKGDRKEGQKYKVHLCLCVVTSMSRDTNMERDPRRKRLEIHENQKHNPLGLRKEIIGGNTGWELQCAFGSSLQQRLTSITFRIQQTAGIGMSEEWFNHSEQNKQPAAIYEPDCASGAMVVGKRNMPGGVV